MNIQIAEVQRNELQELQNISRETFYQAFSGSNTEANMNFFLDNYYSAEKLLLEWMNPHTLFFFAKNGARTAGYLKLNTATAQTVQPNEFSLEIERIYIDETMKGHGIGRLLIETAEKVAREKQLHTVWLGVWEHNHAAIRFYEKNGFRVYDKHLFQLGDDAQTDLLMRKAAILT